MSQQKALEPPISADATPIAADKADEGIFVTDAGVAATFWANLMLSSAAIGVASAYIGGSLFC